MNYHPALAPSIIIDRTLVNITKEVLSAYLLDYIMKAVEYKGEDGWLKTSVETVSRETTLTLEQISTATAKLIQLQLIRLRSVMEDDLIIETWYHPNFDLIGGLVHELIENHKQARK